MQAEPEAKSWGDPPDERTVARWLRDFLENNPDPIQRAMYRHYHWPESHQSGVVPWEAQRIARFIKRYYGERKLTVRVVTWAYRLTQAAPDMPWYLPADDPKARFSVLHIAQHLAAHETAQGGPSIMWSLSVPEENRVSYAEIVDDLLDRELWKDHPMNHDVLWHRNLESRGPIAIMGWGALASADTLAELGYLPEDIQRVIDMQMATVDVTGDAVVLNTIPKMEITDLGEKQPGEKWAYEKNKDSKRAYRLGDARNDEKEETK